MDMEMLRETVLDFSDDRLLGIYRNERDEYNPEAFKIFEKEVARRGLDPSVVAAAKERTEFAHTVAAAAAANLSRDDLAPLDHPFSKSDTVIANAILRDSKVPYIINKYDVPDAADGAGAEMFAVLVYKDALSSAKELIHEQFEAGPNGIYALRRSDIIDRIKAFNAYDVEISPAAADAAIEVDLQDRARSAIVRLAETLINEADAVEADQGRVVFFYDSLEPLIEKLNRGASSLTRTDFLAIIEICQIYCEDERYDSALNNTAASILDFFLG